MRSRKRRREADEYLLFSQVDILLRFSPKWTTLFLCELPFLSVNDMQLLTNSPLSREELLTPREFSNDLPKAAKALDIAVLSVLPRQVLLSKNSLRLVRTDLLC